MKHTSNKFKRFTDIDLFAKGVSTYVFTKDFGQVVGEVEAGDILDAYRKFLENDPSVRWKNPTQRTTKGVGRS